MQLTKPDHRSEPALRKAVIVSALLLSYFSVTTAHAASFDCKKASTAVEKLICADAQLSKLDEELAAAYRDAMGNAGQAEKAALREDQAAWLKSRNACKDRLCIEGAYRTTIATLTASARGPGPAGAVSKPRYNLAHGKGWSVCEAYLKFLNATPASEEPPMCDLKLKRVPGMREPDWEVLDLQQNLKLVHEIELILGGGRIEPAPDRDFERWKAQFRERTQVRGEQPRLRRTRMKLVLQEYFEIGAAEVGGPRRIPTGRVETLLAYDLDLTSCEKELRKARQGRIGGLGRTQPNLFVFDEATQRVMGSGGYALRLEGEWWLYDGRPYYVNRQFGDAAGPKRGSLDRGGHLYIKRVEPSSSMLPGNPPYLDREICRIRFDYPFPEFDCTKASTQVEKAICGIAPATRN